MSFPNDIKRCMKDCILKIFWPREDILQFLADNGCTKKDLKIIENFKEQQLSRSKMVDLMFQYLTEQYDGGLGQFRAMLRSLLNWSHFDPYYFDNLKKLNREDAERCIEHLRQLEEIRDAKIREERKRREELEQEKQQPKQTLEELKNLYFELIAGKVSKQTRGYELEHILQELAKLSSLEVTSPFKSDGEQIDGAIKYDGEHYLIEAKWQEKEASNEPVYQFAGKVEGKMYGRGIFISIHGYSPNVISSLVKGKAIKTIFIDGEDLILVIENHLSFVQMLDKKVKAAQTKGLIYIHPLTNKAKIEQKIVEE